MSDDTHDDPMQDGGALMPTLRASYGPDFERAVVTVLLNVPDVCATLLPLMEPGYFEDDAHARIIEHAKALRESTNKSPSRVSVAAVIHEAHARANGAAQATLQRALDISTSEFAMSSADVEFVRAKAGEFVQRAATREALLRAIELHEKGKHDDAVTLLIKSRDRVASALTSATDDGIEHFNTLAKLNGYVARNRTSSNCPYGIPKLDALMRGGLERGCLGMFMGPPGRGKTRALVQGGATALGHGMVVVHVTLELSKEDVAMRYDARLTGIPINDIKRRPKHHAKRIHTQTEMLRALGGALFIQQWAPGEATLLDLASYLHRVQDKLSKPVDVLLLDYVDLLKPLRGDERWEQHGQMAVGSKRLAVTENLRLWSASQTKTESFSRRVLQLSDVSDTVEKVRISDVILGLCQTEAEKRANRMRLVILKNRLGGNESKVIDCLVRDDTQSLTEDFTHTDARDASEDDY